MIYFEIATGGFHGYFYYVNRVTLVIIAKFERFISVLTKEKCVIYRHTVQLKQNKLLSLFITFTLRRMSYFGVLCQPLTQCK